MDLLNDLINTVIILTFINMIVPTLLGRILHFNVLWRGNKKDKSVSITFDDGPDPIYTKKVLDLLDKYGIKGCFFLVGEKVKKCPEVVRLIAQKGHDIGIHAYTHDLKFIINPLKTKLEMLKTYDIIKETANISPKYARPPWGCFNPFYYSVSRKLNFKVVLWTFMSWDWGKTTEKRIVKRVMSKVKNGSILIFHDSGTTFGAYEQAPTIMISALEKIIQKLRAKGYAIKKLDEVC